jgi:elongation factor G
MTAPVYANIQQLGGAVNSSSPISPLRDIGILAHIDAGKTSLTERILFVTGRIRSPGDIDDGTTVTDYLAVERERGITVKAAAINFMWERPSVAGAGGGVASSYRVNLIDTPGHVDFSTEVRRSLHALDGAVVLVCAVAGVQSRTESLYRACVRRGAPRIVFVNKMDRRGASFERALGDVVSELDPDIVAIQLPWGEGESFRGVVDLVDMVAYDFAASTIPFDVDSGPSFRPRPLPIPPELEAAAALARATLIEKLAGGSGVDGQGEGDRALLEDFVAGRPSPPDRVRSALRAAALAGRATPLLCGTAFVDGAAALLLDAVADYLPSPAEAVRPVAVESGSGESVVLGPEDGFSALVFKTSGDRHFGRLSWARVRSGVVAAGDKVLDAGTGSVLRVQKIFGIQADRLESVERAVDGDIVALALADRDSNRGREDARSGGLGFAGATGTTLCDPRRPVVYEPIVFGEPVMSLALEPRTRADGEALRSGTAALADEDPSIRLREDPQTGRVELSGMGELQLEVAVERLRRDYGVAVSAGAPRVAYRERLRASARASEEFDRDLGGERVRASLSLRVAPGEGGVLFSRDESIRASPALLDAARRGVESALSFGPQAGFPLEGAVVVLEGLALPGGSLSSPGKVGERATEIAASLAAGKALRAAGALVVEPVMCLEVSVAESFLGSVAAAVTGRGGRIESIDSGPDGRSLLSGAAPLRRLFGFASELRSSSEGDAEYAARFLRFEPAPPELRLS